MQADYTTLAPSEFAALVGISINKAYALTKLKDESLRPPGYSSGNRYRIWASELDDYLKGGTFAEAMEAIA